MIKQSLLVFALFNLCACTSGGSSFTLSRNSVTDSNMRVHVATFDAVDGATYNSENCNIAAELFRNQQGTTVRYWCEKGHHRK